MLFEDEVFHPIFRAAVEKSNKLARPISRFRTAEGVSIGIHTHLHPDRQFLVVGIGRKNDEIEIKEDYHLYADGSCHVSVTGWITSTTGWAKHHLDRYEKYTKEDALNTDGWPWLRMQLDTIERWLRDERTVRVDPYQPERILTEEEDEVDRVLARNLDMVARFSDKLRRTKLTPGVHEIDIDAGNDDPRDIQ